jgi:hypothetical protein
MLQCLGSNKGFDMKNLIGVAFHLLLGGLMYQWLFGTDPLQSLGHINTWGVMVFWPFILIEVALASGW